MILAEWRALLIALDSAALGEEAADRLQHAINRLREEYAVAVADRASEARDLASIPRFPERWWRTFVDERDRDEDVSA